MHGVVGGGSIGGGSSSIGSISIGISSIIMMCGIARESGTTSA